MTYERVLIALADPTRRAVFEALARQPASVGQLAEGLPVSRPAVSQHLKALRDAGLVEVSADGARRIYAAVPDGLQDLRQYLDQFWGEVLQAFADDIQNEGPSDA